MIISGLLLIVLLCTLQAEWVHGGEDPPPAQRRPNDPVDFNVTTFAICAIALGEDLYIEEWIRFHLYLGFDRVNIYDNSANGSVVMQQMSQKYARVIVKHLPALQMQLTAYDHCIHSYKKESVFAAFIDIDEFIVLRKAATIRDFMHLYSPRGGALGIHRLQFGDNRHQNYTSEPVLKRFTTRSATVDPLVKTIAYVPDIAHTAIHTPVLNRGSSHSTFRAVNSTESIAAIYHYKTKTFPEFRLKRLRGDAYSKSKHQMYSEGGDREILIADNFVRNNADTYSVIDTAAWDLYERYERERGGLLL
jgi:hypothetical protein